MKKTKLLIAVCCASAIFSMSSLAGEWKQTENGWQYQNDDGSYANNGWQEISGNKYYFDANGCMLHDTTTPDGQQVGSDGSLVAAPLFDYDLDTCHITYTHHEIAKDYEGNDCLIIYYNYTNKRSEPCSAMGNSAYIALYQDGIQKDPATLPYGSKNSAVDNRYRNVMSGITIEVAKAFKIDNRNEVTLEISDIFDVFKKSPRLQINLSL